MACGAHKSDFIRRFHESLIYSPLSGEISVRVELGVPVE
jgi:hypothetical protein